MESRVVDSVSEGNGDITSSWALGLGLHKLLVLLEVSEVTVFRVCSVEIKNTLMSIFCDQTRGQEKKKLIYSREGAWMVGGERQMPHHNCAKSAS